ncbi:C-C motif chemokine 19 [Anabarilius grahami]|uniref:C-C motif chemokine 19 n=1 Tax=Anabarilius grahami TaxID=495550 RepID=A0A3N0XSV3_ANAGA|nr:C-C motif chemokine 19 [Anabarilius grahami]
MNDLAWQASTFPRTKEARGDGAEDCCLTTSNRRIPQRVVTTFTIQTGDGACRIPATIFVTKKGLKLCAPFPSENNWFLLGFRSVLASGPFAAAMCTRCALQLSPQVSELRRGLYPAVKAALRHERADSEEDHEGLGHLKDVNNDLISAPTLVRLLPSPDRKLYQPVYLAHNSPEYQERLDFDQRLKPSKQGHSPSSSLLLEHRTGHLAAGLSRPGRKAGRPPAYNTQPCAHHPNRLATTSEITSRFILNLQIRRSSA